MRAGAELLALDDLAAQVVEGEGTAFPVGDMGFYTISLSYIQI